MAFYELEPFGDARADLRAGIIASTLANVNRGKETKAFTPQDFMLFTDEIEREDDLDEASQVKNLFYNLGVEIIEKDGKKDGV